MNRSTKWLLLVCLFGLCGHAALGQSTADRPMEMLSVCSDSACGHPTGSQAAPCAPAGNGAAGLTPASCTPGREAWRQSCPQIAYIVVAAGHDENYFETLALGNPMTIVNYATRDAREAQRAAGLSGPFRIVPVKVFSVDEYYRLLHEGLVPVEGSTGRRLYTVGEMQPQKATVLGLTVLGHGGADGPYVAGKPMWYEYFRQDRESQSPDSFHERLAFGARFRFCNCHSGNCYLWYERDEPDYRAAPSVAHGTASMFADKRVVAFGKYCRGDIANDCYVEFSCPEGLSYPVRKGIAKEDYSFGTTKAASRFQTLTVRHLGESQKKQFLDWYRSRGVTARVSNDELTIEMPTPTWYNRGSAKPAVLKALVEASDSSPLKPCASNEELRRRWLQTKLLPVATVFDSDPKVFAKCAGKLKKAIVESKRFHDGRIDMDDFRLWAVIFRPDWSDTNYRACLCDDAHACEVRRVD